MRKNKLFTALAAVALLTGSGVGLVSSNQNVTTVQAATKKAAKVARVRVKRGAALYQIKFNRQGTKVLKIIPLVQRGRRQALRGGSFPGIWSAKYKGVKYYYIGNSGNQFWSVRARDAKVTSKKHVPTINAFVKANQSKRQAAINKRQALAKSWQNKIDAARPKTFPAKVNAETTYWNVVNGKIQTTTDKLSMGTNLTIIYKIGGALHYGDQPIDAKIRMLIS